MGAYLSQPVTDKEKYQGSTAALEYGGASMQVSAAGAHKRDLHTASTSCTVLQAPPGSGFVQSARDGEGTAVRRATLS